MRTMTLYRASDDDIIVGSASFAVSLDAARAYLSNPGFGGRSLWRTTVEIDPASLLDLYDMDHEAAVAEVCSLTGLSDPGAIGIDEWIPRIDGALQDAGIRWVRVRESYPEDTETWICIAGGEDPEMEQIEE